MNPDNFFLGNKRRSMLMCELGKLPTCSIDEEGENGVANEGGEELAAGACGGVVEGRVRGSVGSEAVDRALVQHLIHCECLLQVSGLV